jgi:UDP-N-acetylglucosamine--N-acetylmuramyl-(pentapeptide) pyrophosphoryl-undecaprenol N-acetylglucosamine transferase
MPKIPSMAMFGFAHRMWKTWRSCKSILKEVHADVVLGMGGFTSLPPVIIAKRMGCRTYVHDSNALPGKSNRMAARWCNSILLGVDAAAHYFGKAECIVTGTPVREELETPMDREEAYKILGIQPKKKLVLAMGGSQGAKNLNSLIVEGAKLCSDFCEFLIIAGKADYDRVCELAKGLDHVHVMSFCSCMGAAYSAADVVISRSGASSLTELAHLGKPSLLVPYPFAADDHQAHNARVFSANKAARVCREESLTGETIASFLSELLTDDTVLQASAKAAKDLDVPDAAERIAHVIEQ